MVDRVTSSARSLSGRVQRSRSWFWPVLLKHLHHVLCTSKRGIATKIGLKLQNTASTTILTCVECVTCSQVSTPLLKQSCSVLQSEQGIVCAMFVQQSARAASLQQKGIHPPWNQRQPVGSGSQRTDQSCLPVSMAPALSERVRHDV